MKREELYEEWLGLRPQIDERLRNLDFAKTKEMLLWLAKSESYRRLKIMENQLIILDFFCSVWLEEKKRLPEVGIDEDIFWGVHSLEDMEKKYHSLYFGVMRFEVAMPEEYYEQVIDTVIDYRISGIALARIIIRETEQIVKNILKAASQLRERNQFAVEMILLEEAEKFYPKNEEILLQLADCWMFGQQWERARECLAKIDKPQIRTHELIKDLEKKIADENS